VPTPVHPSSTDVGGAREDGTARSAGCPASTGSEQPGPGRRAGDARARLALSRSRCRGQAQGTVHRPGPRPTAPFNRGRGRGNGRSGSCARDVVDRMVKRGDGGEGGSKPVAVTAARARRRPAGVWMGRAALGGRRGGGRGAQTGARTGAPGPPARARAIPCSVAPMPAQGVGSGEQYARNPRWRDAVAAEQGVQGSSPDEQLPPAARSAQSRQRIHQGGRECRGPPSWRNGAGNEPAGRWSTSGGRRSGGPGACRKQQAQAAVAVEDDAGRWQAPRGL